MSTLGANLEHSLAKRCCPICGTGRQGIFAALAFAKQLMPRRYFPDMYTNWAQDSVTSSSVQPPVS